jgi:putative MATE family efflux protein
VSGIIRALGDSRTPFYFLVISTVINIALDLIFILKFNMGVAGAGWATIIAQALSGILCLIYMKKKYEILKISPKERKLNFRLIRTLLINGLPMGLQYSITAIGTIMLQSAVNVLDAVYVSAYGAALKVKQLAMSPFDSMATATSTFCSQNLGAGKTDRIRKGVKNGIAIAMVYAVCIAVVLYFTGSKIAWLFVDKSETEVLAAVQLYLCCVAFFFPALAVLNTVRMTLQGLGYGGIAIFAGWLELAARACMSLLVIPRLGYIAVCYTDQTAWIVAAVFVSVVFILVMRHLEKKMKKK